MGNSIGKTIRISPFRRLVVDLMYFSQKVPSVTIDRRMNLARIVEARQRCSPRPSWVVLFTKAYAIIAHKYPELRQSYLTFPWHRLYEHPHNVATLNIGRELPDERVILYCLIRSPENRSLAELDAIVRHHKETPVEHLRSYRRAVATSKIPWPFRRFFWWGALNFFGRRRCHNFGTFGITSVAEQGAGALKLIPVLTSTLHYGMFDKEWNLDVRLSFDHRVIDGSITAQALVELEKTLNGAIADELDEMSQVRVAA